LLLLLLLLLDGVKVKGNEKKKEGTSRIYKKRFCQTW